MNRTTSTPRLLVLSYCIALFIALVPGRGVAQQVEFLSMGDWGEGVPAQTAVASALADFAASRKPPIDAMVLAGDNFYVPLSGTDDPAWQTLFEKMYDPVKLNFPFYASLGNHDYDGNKYLIEINYARQHPESRWKIPDRWYRIDLPAAAAKAGSNVKPLATVLMLDSNQPNLTPVQWNQQINWLEKELSNPRNGAWVICCAHHPLFSNGAAADNGVLQHDWGTLFKKHHVDFYLCGHEHNLQHLEIQGWDMSFVLAGGGGAHPHPMLRSNRGPFSRTIYGFADFQFTPALATVSFIGTDGKPLHVFERTKSGATRVVMTTPSDPAIDKPLEAILGIYKKLQGAGTQPTTRPATFPSTEP